MTEQTRPRLGSTESDLHFRVSKLFVGTAIGAVVTTVALVIAIVTYVPSRQPPPAPDSPPPPPTPPLDLQTFVIFTILTGLCIGAWLAFLVAFARDHVLRSIRAGQAAAEELRREIAEYGEQRETDGYLM